MITNFNNGGSSPQEITPGDNTNSGKENASEAWYRMFAESQVWKIDAVTTFVAIVWTPLLKILRYIPLRRILRNPSRCDRILPRRRRRKDNDLYLKKK